MRRTFAILAALLLPALSGRAACTNERFVVGEISEYKISWMKIPLAWSKTLTDEVEENGRKLIRIRTISKTYPAYRALYAVDDLRTVWIDPATALPVRQEVLLNEGKVHRNHVTTFDHAAGEAMFVDRVSGTTNRVAIPPDTREILSFLYASRNEDLKIFCAREHRLYSNGKVYPVKLFLRRRKKLKLPRYGKIKSVEIEPATEAEGLFNRTGRIFFWVSEPRRRMITCVRSKISLGWVDVRLQRVLGPGTDLWTREPDS